MKRLQPLLLALGVQNLFLGVDSKCYHHDGSERLLDVECNPGGESTCCSQGYACLSNNMCKLTEYVPDLKHRELTTYERGSCTDKTWQSTKCPQFCVNAEADSPRKGPQDGNAAVHKCDGDVDRYWCINSRTLATAEDQRCLEDEVYFQFAGTPTTVTIIGITSSTTQTSASPSASSTTQSKDTTTLPPPAPSSPTPELASESKDKTVAIAVGASVSLGVIAIAIAIAAWLIWRKMHRNKRRDSQLRVADHFHSELIPVEKWSHSDPITTHKPTAELEYRSLRQELPPAADPQELPAHSVRRNDV